MHILMITGDLAATSGGPPQVMFGTARALAARGVRVALFALAPDGGAAPEGDPDFADLPVAIRRFSRSGPARLARSQPMNAAVAAEIAGFDALHVHGIWEACLSDAARLFRRAGKPVFVSAHGMLDRWSLRQSRWRKTAALTVMGTGTMLAKATAIVFGTRDESEQARHPGTPPHAIIPNGIDLDALDAQIAGDPAPLHACAPMLTRPGRTILYFSRIHPKKGLDLLVEAFCATAAEHIDTRLLIAGIPQDAAYLAAIEQRIERSGLGDRVAIVTGLSGAAAKPALGQASIFALPSHQEGFSVAIIEALGAGLPVLITDQCHLPEIAGWGAGQVVADDAAGVEAGLRALLALSPEELARTGSRGRQAVAEHYTLDSVAARLEALYAGAPC